MHQRFNMEEKDGWKEEKDFFLVLWHCANKNQEWGFQTLWQTAPQLKGSQEIHCGKRWLFKDKNQFDIIASTAKNPNSQYCIPVCAQFPQTLIPSPERRGSQSHCRKHQGMWWWCEWHREGTAKLVMCSLWGHFGENRFFRSAVYQTLVDRCLHIKINWTVLEREAKLLWYACSINLKSGYTYATPCDRRRWTIFTFRKFLNNNRKFSFFWLKHDAANVPWFPPVFGCTRGPDPWKLIRMP